MKKSKKSRILLCACLVMVFTSLFAIVGCGEKPTPPPTPNTKVTVTVNNGVGGGEFEKGTQCTVKATIPTDEEFSKWIIGGEQVSLDNPYTFTVKESVTVSAVVGKPYNLIVEGGKIGDTTNIESRVVENEVVTITAKSTTNKKFLYWIINDSETKISENPYKLTISGNTVAKAVFDEICLISVDSGKVYQGAPEGAAKSLRIKMGETCVITADAAPRDQKFKCWYYINENRQEVEISQEATYSFVVTNSRKIFAKYDFYYVLTVEGGYINDNKEMSVGDIWANNEVTVTAIIPENQGLLNWKIAGEIVSINAVYTFKVTENTIITAEFSSVIQLVAPANDKNQMFTKKPSGYSDMIIEFDRQKDANGARKTAFVEGVDYVLFHLYTSTDANKNEYVGSFKMVQTIKGSSAQIETLDGSKKFTIGSNPGDYYFDRVSNADFFGFIKSAVGDSYSATQNYYVAAQSIAVQNSIYTNSEISEIGTSVIRESN